LKTLTNLATKQEASATATAAAASEATATINDHSQHLTLHGALAEKVFSQYVLTADCHLSPSCVSAMKSMPKCPMCFNNLSAQFKSGLLGLLDKTLKTPVDWVLKHGQL